MKHDVFVPKYRADFWIECSAAEGSLRQLLQTLFIIKAEFGIETKQIRCNFAFQRLKYIPMSYEDAKVVISGLMDEKWYIGRNKI